MAFWSHDPRRPAATPAGIGEPVEEHSRPAPAPVHLDCAGRPGAAGAGGLEGRETAPELLRVTAHVRMVRTDKGDELPPLGAPARRRVAGQWSRVDGGRSASGR